MAGSQALPRRFAAGKAGRLRTRSADTAAFCVDHLFPHVPIRQYVLTVPFRVRFQTAYSPRLASVYASQPGGWLLFHPLPAPRDEDVARIAHAVCRKVSRILARSKTSDDGQTSLLDALANASVQGLVASGPRRGCRVLRMGGFGEDAEAAVLSKRCAEVAGFNVYANTCARANDRERLEHLVKYLARPPIAGERLTELPDGRLALELKQPWRDGTRHVVFTPHELIEKLIPLIPRPRSHLVRYHGILGPAAKDREKVVPRSGPAEFGRPTPVAEGREIDPSRSPRFNRLPWAVLLKRVFLVDVLKCPKCAGRMKIVAVVTAPTGTVDRQVCAHAVRAPGITLVFPRA